MEGRQPLSRSALKDGSMKRKGIPEKYGVWIEARKRFKLSHAQIQMARELGLNPKKFGSLDNRNQEAWKAPLGDFIEELYRKHFKKAAPDVVRSIEEMLTAVKGKKGDRKVRKQARASEAASVEAGEQEAGSEGLQADTLCARSPEARRC